MSVLAVGTAATVSLAPAAAADPAAPALPTGPGAVADVGNYGDLLVDDAHQRVFVGGETGLAVFGFDGVRQALLPVRARSLELHDGVVYASSVDTVSRIDASSLQVLAPLATSLDRTGSLAWAGNRLWTYDLDGTAGTSSLYPVTATGRTGPAVPATLVQASDDSLATSAARPAVLWAWSYPRCAGYRIVVGSGDTATATPFPDNGFDLCDGFTVSPAGDRVVVSTRSGGIQELNAVSLRPTGLTYARPRDLGSSALSSYGTAASPRLVGYQQISGLDTTPTTRIKVYAYGSSTVLANYPAPTYVYDVGAGEGGRQLFVVQATRNSPQVSLRVIEQSGAALSG